MKQSVIISLLLEFETRTEERSLKEIDSSEVTNFICGSLTLFAMKDASRGLLMTAKSESCGHVTGEILLLPSRTEASDH